MNCGAYNVTYSQINSSRKNSHFSLKTTISCTNFDVSNRPILFTLSISTTVYLHLKTSFATMSRASEHTPLLGRDGSQSGLTEMSIWKGTIDLAKATIPISASFALQNIVQALSIITSGKFGADQLDIASYGFMFATCTGSMVAIGGATALDTLCSQAVSSSKTQNHPTILGKHLQQSLFALSVLFCGIVVPIWVFSGNIFVALGQEHGFAMETGRFLILMIPGGYLQMVAECFKKYGQVQGSSNSVGYIVCVAAVAGIVANVVLINNVGLGAFGAPAAFFIYQLITVILLTVMIARKEREKQTFKLIRKWRDMVDSLGTNLFLGITGVLTIATEWWRYDSIHLLLELRGEVDLFSVSKSSLSWQPDFNRTKSALKV